MKQLYHAIIWPLIILCQFNSCTSSLPGSSAVLTPVADNILAARIDSMVVQAMTANQIPGLALGIVMRDSLLYVKGYGVRNIHSNEPVMSQSIFHTASISKIFTASAIMTLVNHGALSLDDRLSDLMPELTYADEGSKKITVRDLMCHTSGLPDIKNYHWERHHIAGNSLQTYLEDLQLRSASEPSIKFQYSNLGYDILGRLVEVTSRRPFEDFVKDALLLPAGMEQSDFRYFNIPDSLKTSPHGKRLIINRIYVRKTYPYTREHSPSSTLNASAEELSYWMKSFLQTVKTPDSTHIYHMMIQPVSQNFSHMGLGFQLLNFEGHRAVGHFGGDRGFRSIMMILPQEQIGVVVLANCDYTEDFRLDIVQNVIRLLVPS